MEDYWQNEEVSAKFTSHTNPPFDIPPIPNKIKTMNLLELKLRLETLLPDWKWTLPPSPDLGILSSPKAFEVARMQGKSPVEVAATLIQEVENALRTENIAAEAKLAGPYINIFPHDKFLSELAQNSSDNFKINLSDKHLLLEYVSPNIAKPLHAGHLVNAVIGENLKRVLSLKYSNLETEIYWGDWGIQFGIILWTIRQIQNNTVSLEINGELVSLNIDEYDEDPIQTLVRIYVWGNQQKDLIPDFDNQIREEVIKLENGDKNSVDLWLKFAKDSKKVILEQLNILGVSNFDHEFGESYYQERMTRLTKFMDKYGLWEVEGKGRFIDLDKMSAQWEQQVPLVRGQSEALGVARGETEGFGVVANPIPFDKIATYGRCYLIQSKDGYTTYPFRDIAARWHWAEDLQADIMITLTDHTQSHNFHQAFSIVSYLASKKEFLELSDDEVSNRLELENLVHIPYGFLKLPEGKMSTRKGNFVTATDILEQIQAEAKLNLQERYPDLEKSELDYRSLKLSLAAIKWTILSKDIIKDTVLNIPQILTFEGNTGVYQLYTFARLNSILRKNECDLNSNLSFDLSLLNNEEKTILNFAYQLPIILEDIAQNYKPHLLSGYLFTLSTMVNKWYGIVSVSNETDQGRKETLLFFCQHLALLIQQTLGLMGIETLDNL